MRDLHSRRRRAAVFTAVAGALTRWCRCPASRRRRVHRTRQRLRVIVSEDHVAPVFSVAVAYNVGSRDERAGRTGFAHLFEHMMFKGSEQVGTGEHFFTVYNNGGTMNGTTNKERTLYYETMPANQLEAALFLEADRMRSLAIAKRPDNQQRRPGRTASGRGNLATARRARPWTSSPSTIPRTSFGHRIDGRPQRPSIEDVAAARRTCATMPSSPWSAMSRPPECGARAQALRRLASSSARRREPASRRASGVSLIDDDLARRYGSTSATTFLEPSPEDVPSTCSPRAGGTARLRERRRRKQLAPTSSPPAEAADRGCSASSPRRCRQGHRRPRGDVSEDRAISDHADLRLGDGESAQRAAFVGDSGSRERAQWSWPLITFNQPGSSTLVRAVVEGQRCRRPRCGNISRPATAASSPRSRAAAAKKEGQ